MPLNIIVQWNTSIHIAQTRLWISMCVSPLLYCEIGGFESGLVYLSLSPGSSTEQASGNMYLMNE